MELTRVLFLAFFLFLFVVLTARCGIRTSWWSAITLATLIILVYINVFFPPVRIARLELKAPLFIYASIQFLGVILIILYILYHCMQMHEPCD